MCRPFAFYEERLNRVICSLLLAVKRLKNWTTVCKRFALSQFERNQGNQRNRVQLAPPAYVVRGSSRVPAPLTYPLDRLRGGLCVESDA